MNGARIFFEGRTKISVEGLNLNKLITEIIRAGIDIYDFTEPKNRKVTFSVDNTSRKKLIALCNNLCYNFTIERVYGLSEILRSSRFRLGLIAGIIILIAGIVLFNSFIWSIDISGTDRILKSEVAEVLRENGIRRGVLRNKIQPKELADYLTANFKDASMVYIKTRGTTLNIEIVETLYKDDVIDRDKPTDITAKVTGRIDKLVVFAGTPLVKKGDMVRSGQVLIANYEDNLLPDGVTVERTFLKAMGEAEMTVWHTAEVTFAENTIQYVRTGNSARVSELKIFGKGFGKKGKNTFEVYESVSSTETLFKWNLMPFKRHVTTYYELNKQETVRNFAEFEESLKKQAMAEAKLKLPENSVITSEYTHVSGGAGLYRVTGVIATNVRIGG